jgi:hypothetical protein
VLAGRSFIVENRILYLETQSLIIIKLSIKARVMLDGYTD